MKKCTYCGKEYSDKASVCAIDQQPLVPANQTAATPTEKPTKAPAARTVKPALMVRLRELHLYLGCIFAPMLLLFALTGIWQTIGVRETKWMGILSSIHKSARALKSGKSLTSPLLRWFIVMMAIAFIVTTLLGVMMAVNQGRNRRKACYCLGFGIAFPLFLILLCAFA